MVQEMVVTLREGGETSLILALLFSALKATRHRIYRLAAWAGTLLAVIASVAVGLLLRNLGSLGPFFEGSLAWIGAGFVASLALQLHAGGFHRDRLPDIDGDTEPSRPSWAATFAVASFAFVAVIREGLETALFLSNGSALRGEGAWLGAVIGLVAAAALGIAIYFGYRRLRISAFMRTTEFLLAGLVASLFLSGAVGFAEAGFLRLPAVFSRFHETWIRSGAFLQILLCSAPFIYVWLTRGSRRAFVRATGVALLLLFVPGLLSATVRGAEHAAMTPQERTATWRVELAVRDRTSMMQESLSDLDRFVRAVNIDHARISWIQARSQFTQLEPYLAKIDAEAADELNGEMGGTEGFHGVESILFPAGAPWTGDTVARRALLEQIADLRARADHASSNLRAIVWTPGRVRNAWADYRWTFMGRLDGEESVVSGTSLVEMRATLDAMDSDLGHPAATAAVRRALEPAVIAASGAPPYREWTAESAVASEALHQPLPPAGPDRGFDLVDRASLRRAASAMFDGIASVETRAAAEVAP
jgi:FTR1 family protein